MRVGLRSLLFTLCIPCSATVWIPWLILAHQMPADFAVPVLFRVAGGLLMIVGGVLYLGCLWDFTFIGRGTPAVWDPPVVFVSRGPYRFVRNPMYLSILTILIGEALFFQSGVLAWMAAGVGMGFHFFVVVYEEPALRQKFGPPYERYCSEISRWLPRVAERHRE